jgi:predicted double-glycine peptidase
MKVIDLSGGRQMFDSDCGAKALQTMFAFYGDDVREDGLLKELGTTEDGTKVSAIMKAAKAHGYKVRAGHLSFETLKETVGKGLPVIVMVQAWADRVMTLDDWREDWDDGHYAIVIGVEDDIVVFEDPSSVRRTWMSKEEFLVRWHDVDSDSDERFENFGMVVYGKPPEPRTKTEHMN